MRSSFMCIQMFGFTEVQNKINKCSNEFEINNHMAKNTMKENETNKSKTANAKSDKKNNARTHIEKERERE